MQSYSHRVSCFPQHLGNLRIGVTVNGPQHQQFGVIRLQFRNCFQQSFLQVLGAWIAITFRIFEEFHIIIRVLPPLPRPESLPRLIERHPAEIGFRTGDVIQRISLIDQLQKDVLLDIQGILLVPVAPSAVR